MKLTPELVGRRVRTYTGREVVIVSISADRGTAFIDVEPDRARPFKGRERYQHVPARNLSPLQPPPARKEVAT